MDADVSFDDASPLGRCAESALDAPAAHGRGRGGHVLVIASRGGKEPGGVAMGFPGETIVQGGGGSEKTVHFFQAENSREAVCRFGPNEVEGLPMAPKDVTVTDT